MIEEYKYCINCTHKIPKQSTVCESCQYDQDRPITKEQTELKTIIDGVLLEFYDDKLYRMNRNVWDKFIKKYYPYYIDNLKYNKIIDELIILVFSLKYNNFIDQYAKHSKIEKIDYTIANRIFELILCIFGKNRFDDIKHQFTIRSKQYFEALKDDNPLESVGIMLQFIVQCIINDNNIPNDLLSLDTAKMWAFPSMYHSMLCFDFVAEIIIPFNIILNKWEIQTNM